MCRSLYVILLLLLTACTRRQVGTILPEGCRLQTGDVVLRCGAGMLSHAVLLAEGDEGTYSHVGIVVDSSGVAMIVHAVPDEPDYEGDPDRVKMEMPEKFYHAMMAKQGAVLRHRDSMAAKRAAAKAKEVYRRHTLFDHDYNDHDTTRMYCTELITFAFSSTGAPLRGIESHRLPLPGVDYACVLPSDIYECSDFRLIISF